MDINNLLAMLSKMDKKDLQQGLEQANKILSSNDKKDILNKLKKNNK